MSVCHCHSHERFYFRINYNKYVDDFNLVLAYLEEGWYWERAGDGKLQLVWTKEMEDQDKKENLSPEDQTMRKVQEMASSLIDGIRFTIDLPEKHEAKKVPMLDLAV